MRKQLRRLAAGRRTKVKDTQAGTAAETLERPLEQPAHKHRRSFLHIVRTRVEQRIQRENGPFPEIESLLRRPRHRFAGPVAEMFPKRVQRQLVRIHPHRHLRFARQSCNDPLRPFRAETFAHTVDKFRRKH